jgi:hypothetical protein
MSGFEMNGYNDVSKISESESMLKQTGLKFCKLFYI